MAIVALVNLGLVFFDMSYIPWRDVYLRYLPQFTQAYGQQFKGIEPHRSTVAYLDRVSQLENQVALTGLQSAPSRSLLAQVQALSDEIIDENPFQSANKAGTLERIKRRVREYTRVEDSSKRAFNTFWSEAFLRQNGWQPSIEFFNRRIRPLIETNYYRSIGENGEPIDSFWQLDLWFIGLFAAEYLARTFYLSRRYRGASWLDTMIWRWYDLLLLLSFWRWLRVIPVAFRLQQARLVNFQPLSDRITRGLMTSVAVELTEVVVLRIITQIQEFLKQGDLKKWLLRTESRYRYVDLNNIDEGQAITKHLLTLLVYHVLPRVKPDLDALLQHSVDRALKVSPVYASFQLLPGGSLISQQLTQQLVADISRNVYQVLTTILEDEKGSELVQRLILSLGQALKEEAQQNPAIDEIQTLAIALLEEVKFNYVRQISEKDPETLKLETQRQLYQITQGKA
jgi:hypothetical protein